MAENKMKKAEKFEEGKLFKLNSHKSHSCEYPHQM